MINVLNFHDVSVLNVIGDIHGQFRSVVFNITQRYKLEKSLNIILGDNGFGFESQQFYQELFINLNKKLEKHNNHLIMLRGNHESQLYFNGEENKLFEQFSHIHVIPDYTIVTVNEYFNILCIGGAISVDRTERLQNTKKQTYWSDENVVYNKQILDDINERFYIRMIATHTSPDFTFPLTKFGIEGWIKKDPNLEDDLKTERENVTKIYNHLMSGGQNGIQVWAYGHFHKHNVEYHNNIKFLACNCMEFTEIRF